MNHYTIDPRSFASVLAGAKLGIEKEGLRIDPQGRLSQARHPTALGSALTHPLITTDFSEALIELITPPCLTPEDAIASLSETETFVHRHLADAAIWSASMPCPVSEAEIPIAQYGCSDNGMMKHVYRRGLAHRYGKMMQLIAGIHFNYSFSDNLWPALQQTLGDYGDLQAFIADRYLSTLRNVQRYDWLLLYLFGASPAAHEGFVGARERLQRFDRETCYAPFATSLRMGDMGYTNRLPAGQSLSIDCNSLEAYIRTMRAALQTRHAPYEEIGVVVDGVHQQLNTHLLQIENEYYTSVRPKQITQGDEAPSDALRQRGIRYLELRSLDINPFSPTGVEVQQLRFLEIFMHFCLLSESPPQDQSSSHTHRHNLNLTAYRGRDPSLELICEGRPVRLQHWAKRLFDAMQPMAESLDNAQATTAYSEALVDLRQRLERPALTPSARLLAGMREHGESYSDFILRLSLQHHEDYLGRQLSDARREYYEALARQSQRQQLHLERCSRGRYGTGTEQQPVSHPCAVPQALKCANCSQ